MRFTAALASLALLLFAPRAHAQHFAQPVEERAPRWNMGMMVVILAATSVLNAGIVLWILGGRPDERRPARLDLAPGGASLRVDLP